MSDTPSRIQRVVKETVHYFESDYVFILDSSHKKRIKALQEAVKTEHHPVVLNFEKTTWADLQATCTLLSVLVTKNCRQRRVHVIGPSLDAFPWERNHINKKEGEILKKQNAISPQRLNKLQGIIRRYQNYPASRAKAASFLITWDFFNLIQSHVVEVQFYVPTLDKGPQVQEGLRKCKSILDFHDHYEAIYRKRQGPDEDRQVWPFESVNQRDWPSTVDRLNGPELMTGHLKELSSSHLIESGMLSNVIFYEPMENVFDHAYPKGLDAAEKLCIYTMRFIKIDHKKDSFPVTNRLENLDVFLRRLWTKAKAERRSLSILEFALADSGYGLVETLKESFAADQAYHQEHDIDYAALDERSLGLEILHYAFDPSSSCRENPHPGARGLSWLLDILDRAGMWAVVVESNGLGLFLSKMDGLTRNAMKSGTEGPSGTSIRVFIPMVKGGGKKRFPKKPLEHPVPLLAEHHVRVHHLSDLLMDKKPEEFDTWQALPAQITDGEQGPIILNFEMTMIRRTYLEVFFSSVMEITDLMERLVIINAHRHTQSRMGTLLVERQMREQGIIVPVFGNTLRLVWLGAAAEEETALLDAFQMGAPRLNELTRVIEANPGYFHGGAGFSFNIQDIESITREWIGRRLWDYLDQGGYVHGEPYTLPNGMVLHHYIESHHLLKDPTLSNWMCDHIAMLLRRFYRPERGVKHKSPAVLTSTRFGREISIRITENLLDNEFHFFDQQTINAEKSPLVDEIRERGEVVILLDFMVTGEQVDKLIRLCDDAGVLVMGLIVVIDGDPEREPICQKDRRIDYRPFFRIAQRPDGGMANVRRSEPENPEHQHQFDHDSIVTISRAIRLLDGEEAIHWGHFDLFGSHYQLITNLEGLLTYTTYKNSQIRTEMLQMCESEILKERLQPEVAIVLYDTQSASRLFEGMLSRRPRLLERVKSGRLQFISAPQIGSTRGKQYWLTKKERKAALDKARAYHQDRFSVFILDDVINSGETLIGLLALAKTFAPEHVIAFALINRMAPNQSRYHSSLERLNWAGVSFSCYLHLNIPVYSQDDCPMCRERRSLRAEISPIKPRWLNKIIEEKRRELEIVRRLEGRPVLGELGAQTGSAHFFSWEKERRKFPKERTLLSKILSIYIALYSNVPIHQLLEEVQQHAKQDPQNGLLLLRHACREIARCHHIQRYQKAEGRLLKFLLHRVQSKDALEKRYALEALRFMRIDVLVRLLDDLPEYVFHDPFDEAILAETLLLLNRTLNDQDLAEKAFDQKRRLVDQLKKRDEADEEHVRQFLSVWRFEDYPMLGAPRLCRLFLEQATPPELGPTMFDQLRRDIFVTPQCYQRDEGYRHLDWLIDLTKLLDQLGRIDLPLEQDLTPYSGENMKALAERFGRIMDQLHQGRLDYMDVDEFIERINHLEIVVWDTTILLETLFTEPSETFEFEGLLFIRPDHFEFLLSELEGVFAPEQMRMKLKSESESRADLTLELLDERLLLEHLQQKCFAILEQKNLTLYQIQLQIRTHRELAIRFHRL